MDIFQKEKDGVVILEIVGRLDADTAPEAEKHIKELLAAGTTRLLLDMEKLEYISSAGLRVVLMAVKDLRGKQGKIVLCSLNEYVREVFEVSNFTSIIPIAETVEEALKLFEQG
jgi:anti-anti-sigma factor